MKDRMVGYQVVSNVNGSSKLRGCALGCIHRGTMNDKKKKEKRKKTGCKGADG